MEIVTKEISIECPQCGHELKSERPASFGVDVVRCLACKKFVKIETFARLTRVNVARRPDKIVEIVDEAEAV